MLGRGWRRSRIGAESGGVQSRTAREVWESAFVLPLPNLPLLPLLKTRPPPEGGGVEARVLRYGFQVGLADGLATESADKAFNSQIENSFAATETALVTEAATVAAEIENLRPTRDEAKQRLENWFASKNDDFALTLSSDVIFRDVHQRTVTLALAVLWTFEFMLSLRVANRIYGEPD
jgi:hypothetical protein